ncbi:hypothetical protein [Mucilaginibacter phyllosphaerae]|uniref:Uncharacterized membrane protein YidH (DUF202 family) n=1 Tax=Mucilaginibacter phyllosphaerae TaxID=1812349 RepID=A0A4Y8AK59_9SPHI|nr:hypothetical protein [Mucilaginibacter phyllosphaerae]MBB3967533.1 uncharacterized membrane protein YidH (DUF202 family) [Mucilaginibacter phyllosphaerae]TEW69406.1 hypothetical protein E2R65_04350 [Mucilaginibacter phyllosphaerae]
MLTQDFQQLIIFFICSVFILLIAAGMYCRQRSNAYIGTGRVNDIEAWYLRANIAWVSTACLSLALVIRFI